MPSVRRAQRSWRWRIAICFKHLLPPHRAALLICVCADFSAMNARGDALLASRRSGLACARGTLALARNRSSTRPVLRLNAVFICRAARHVAYFLSCARARQQTRHVVLAGEGHSRLALAWRLRACWRKRFIVWAYCCRGHRDSRARVRMGVARMLRELVYRTPACLARACKRLNALSHQQRERRALCGAACICAWAGALCLLLPGALRWRQFHRVINIIF